MRILQIAVGVFLGIIAVIAVIKYPHWMMDAVKEHNAFVVAKMTPEKLIEKCGKPLSDKQTRTSKQDSYAYRSIEYQGKFSKVTFDFLRDKDTSWFLTGTKIDSEITGAWNKDGSSRVLFQMPCIDKKD